jgi:hypothetical protein
MTVDGNVASTTVGTAYDRDGETEVVPQGDNVAFHIVDSALTAQQFIASNTPDNWERHRIRYIYPEFSSKYFPNDPIKRNEIIFIGDTRFERSQEAVWAEYAHAVEAAAYDYNRANFPKSPRPVELQNGCHRPETESNTAFALGEGWSNFFAHYQGIGWDDDRTYYDATSGLCPPYDDDGTMDGFRVEGSVTAIFWDITDGGPNDDDQINKSFNTILSLFRDHQIQSMWDAYDHLQDDVNDTQALNEIFVTHGIDVEKPWASISGGLSQTTYAPNTTLSGSTGDEHSNITRVQARVDSGEWQTVAGDDANSWSFTQSYEEGTHTVELRATDHWGNNATYTYTVERKSGPPRFDGASGPAASLDDDPLLEDVDGNDETNIFDAITYYNERDSAAMDAYPNLFDFDGDGTAGTVFDAIALYNEVAA